MKKNSRIEKKIRDEAIDTSRFIDWLARVRGYIFECNDVQEEKIVIQQLKERIIGTKNRAFKATRLDVYIKFAKGEIDWIK